MDWLREGVAPNDAVLSVFERAKLWLRSIYAGVRSKLKPEVRSVFEDMVLLHDYPEVQAFERTVGELEGMDKEAMFTDGRRRRLRVQRSGRAYSVDAHDAEGRQLFMRQYGDVGDAAREIAGVPSIDNPTPAGSRAMRMERPDERAARERDAELRIASDDLQVQDVAGAAGAAETQVLYQERGDEDPRRRQQLRNLAEGRKTQLLNRLAELGVDRGDLTPWSTRPLRELEMEDLRRIHTQMLNLRAEGSQETARKYERRDVIRFGRNRVRQIQTSLQRIMRDTKRMPAELRSPLRKLLTDLDLVRRGQTDEARLEVGAPETDPMRLLGTLQAAIAGKFDPAQKPPGTLQAEDLAGKRLSELNLLELERLHNTIAYIATEVTKAQEALQAGYRATATQVGNEVVRDLSRAPPMHEGAVRRTVTQLLGERPGFMLERIGGGLRSALYKTLWTPIVQGAQNKRRLIREVAGRYHTDMRSAGIEMNRGQLESWMRERIEVPGWAAEIHKWTRAEVMSLALMWRDPYDRRNLVDQRSAAAAAETPFTGGLVFTRRGHQSRETVQLSQAQILELIGLLGEQEQRFIGAPVRRMFDDLFLRINAIFREKYGYDLEQSPDYFPVEMAAGHVPDNPESGGAVDFYRAAEAQGSAEPYQGMIQWRTGAVKPMVLRPVNTIINRSLDRAATYVGLEMPLTSARRLMSRKDVTATMRDRFGQDVPQVLNRYLRDMAGNGEIQDGIERALMQLKRNVSVGSLGLSGKVALSQALSLPLYAAHVPGKYIVDSVWEMASPRAARRIMERHTIRDPDFAERSEYGFDPDVETGRMFTGRGVLPADRSRLRRYHERATNILMLGIRGVDRFTVARGEQAAVNHALGVFAGESPMTQDMGGVVKVTAQQARDMSVDDRMTLAYQWANWVTGRTQPSFLPEHMSSFARGRVSKYFASFSGYTNVAFNALRRSIRVAREQHFRDPEANRSAMLAVMTIMVIGPLGVSMLSYLRQMAQGEDEPDPIWKGMVQGQAALVYGVRDVGYFITSGRVRGLGMDNPTAGAVKDLISSGDALGRAIWTEDDDRIERAVERTVASGFRMVGIPYWTPRNWVEAAMEGLD